MKRILTGMVAALMLFCFALAESTELSVYLGTGIDEFTQTFEDAVRTEKDGRLFAATESFSLYASTDDSEGGTGLIDYISIKDEDAGLSILGMTIGMTREEIAAVAAERGLMSQDDIYYDAAADVYAFVQYTDDIATSIACARM